MTTERDCVRFLSIIRKCPIAGLIVFLSSGFSQIKKIESIPVEPILSDSALIRVAGESRESPPDSQQTAFQTMREDTPSATALTDSSDSLLVISADDTLDTTAVHGAPRNEFRSIRNNAFRVGEYLEFEISWKFFKAGTAAMSVGDTVWNGNRPCYYIKTTANSSSVIDVFYKVRDKVESIIDREGMFPWKFKKRLREGHFRRTRHTLFDPYRNLAFVKNDTVVVPPYVQDILSSFYFVRTLPLEVGGHFDIENLSGKDVYPLRVLVHRKQTIKVPAGKFHCLVVEPVLRGEGLFNQKGRLTIWMTDDARKIPVMMKSEVFIGTVDAKLRKYKNTIEL